MSAIIWSFMVYLLCSIIHGGDCSFVYELLETRLENMELKLTDLIGASSNITITKINELNEKVSGDNLRVIHRLARLKYTEESILSKQQSIENHNKLLDKQSKRILETLLDLVISSCNEAKVSEVYMLSLSRINVLCETANHGGGWLVIQQQLNGNTDFYQNRFAYRLGFGTVERHTDFWLGLEAIHLITSSGEYELLVEIKNEVNEEKYAQYDRFKVSSESDGYKLTVGGYSGTAVDALTVHNNAKFSTYDWNNANCGKNYKGGWWWHSGGCGSSNLNGPYKKLAHGHGMIWGSFMKARTYSRMMVRRT